MLPSRGLARSPASALRYSLSSRTKPAQILSTRQFSQAQSQSSVLSKRRLSRASTFQYGQTTPSISASAVGYGASASASVSVSAGIASSVFAQRSGAARNLSLWPFQSKPQTPQTPQTADTPSEFSPELPASSSASAQPPVYETSSLSASASAPSPSLSPSVSPTPAPAPADFVSNAAVPPASQTDLSELPDDLLRGFDSQSFLNIPEHIGYLYELGLDYGRGPTACCQWLVEHIYIYTGWPWWATIAATAFLFRAAIFLPSLKAARNQALMQKLQADPEYAKARVTFTQAAYRTSDRAVMMSARAEMQRLEREVGVSKLILLVNFLMIPFSYGMFRLCRGMAGIPVPGLDTGGLAWFTDLTVHDPFYILPCMSIAMAVVVMKQMQRANLTIEPTQLMIQKIMLYLMPPLIFIGTAWLPAAVQLFFVMVSAGSIVQSQAILTPAIRAWADILPLPDRNPAPGVIQYQSPTNRGFRGALEGGIVAAKKTLNDATGSTDEKTRWKKAQEYERKRAEEERQKATRRIDEARRRRARQ
ncbi:hypothetical protein F4859DRAFT_220387 [Xylaria cf. heliscus]|nr:hypothetical protein F4859DRAFT_220387 [Xylaria cf. heliscus]